MPLGTQPFGLHMNAVKKETSLEEKVLIQSHNQDGTVFIWDRIVDRRIHTKSVKIKFFIAGFRPLTNTEYIHYVGRWVELEPHQLDFYNGGYFLGFYPFADEEKGELHLRLQLFPHPNNANPSEIYIEKITIIDSDFDSALSWLTDPDILPFEPPIIPPTEPPVPPIGPNPNPNCVWPF